MSKSRYLGKLLDGAGVASRTLGCIGQVIDWNAIDKDQYLSAMQRSPVKDLEIKALLQSALTDKINDRALFMRGIDISYHYEGYSWFRVEEL